MKKKAAMAALKRHESEFRKLSVVSLSLFGSTARDEATDDSDVDLAVTLANVGQGFAYFGRLDKIERLASRILKPRGGQHSCQFVRTRSWQIRQRLPN
jgi:predicted nucleotidyltransferase